LVLSPGRFVSTSSCGAKNYDYGLDPIIVGSWSATFTVTNNGTGTSNTLHVLGGDPHFVLSNDTCSGSALAPSGTCTFDLAFTAPAGCNPGDSFPTHLDVGFQDNGCPYIHLEAFGFCPF
jgi:hypothetical protein